MIQCIAVCASTIPLRCGVIRQETISQRATAGPAGITRRPIAVQYASVQNARRCASIVVIGYVVQKHTVEERAKDDTTAVIVCCAGLDDAVSDDGISGFAKNAPAALFEVSVSGGAGRSIGQSETR